MTRRSKYDPARAWLQANATDIEQVEAFKAYASSHWGMPTFGEIKSIVIAGRVKVVAQ